MFDIRLGVIVQSDAVPDKISRLTPAARRAIASFSLTALRLHGYHVSLMGEPAVVALRATNLPA
jgi:hypothetical protein